MNEPLLSLSVFNNWRKDAAFGSYCLIGNFGIGMLVFYDLFFPCRAVLIVGI